MATYAKRRNGNGGGNTFKRARLSTSNSNNNNNNNNNNNSSTSTSTLLSPISKRSITKSINNKINNNKNGQGQLYDDFLEIYNFQTDTKSNEDKSTNSQLDLFEMPDIDGDKSISRPKKISDDSITGAYKKKVTYNRLNKLKSKSNSNSNSNFKPRPKPRPKPKPVSKNILKINQTSNINPWNELLDNIEESTVYLPKISLIDDENESDENDQVQIGVNEAQEGGETITTTSIINLPILLNFDNEGEDEEEEEENLQQQLIQSRSLSTSPSNSNSNSNSLKPNKTYAQDRSYLILDQSYIDVKQELGESISRKHDFDNNNNDNTEEEGEEKENEDINNNKLLSSSSSSGGGRVINVHDFKIKSEFKINPILQDIIDGLLSNSFNLQLSSLLEIISKKKKLSISTDMTDMTDMTEGIIDIIIQYVLPLIDSNNKLINWLSSKIIFDIWKSQKSTTIKLKEVEVEVEEKEKEEKRILFRDTFVNSIQNRLNDIEKNLNLEEENIDELKIIINQIPKIYRSMINELLE